MDRCIPYTASSPRVRAQLQRCSNMSSKLNPSRYKTLLLQEIRLKSKTKPTISLHCPRNLKILVSLCPINLIRLDFSCDSASFSALSQNKQSSGFLLSSTAIKSQVPEALRSFDSHRRTNQNSSKCCKIKRNES